MCEQPGLGYAGDSRRVPKFEEMRGDLTKPSQPWRRLLGKSNKAS